LEEFISVILNYLTNICAKYVSHIISSTENYFGRKSSDKIIMLSKISLICKDS